jgi:hypothetical protein
MKNVTQMELRKSFVKTGPYGEISSWRTHRSGNVKRTNEHTTNKITTAAASETASKHFSLNL